MPGYPTGSHSCWCLSSLYTYSPSHMHTHTPMDPALTNWLRHQNPWMPSPCMECLCLYWVLCTLLTACLGCLAPVLADQCMTESTIENFFPVFWVGIWKKLEVKFPNVNFWVLLVKCDRGPPTWTCVLPKRLWTCTHWRIRAPHLPWREEDLILWTANTW